MIVRAMSPHGSGRLRVAGRIAFYSVAVFLGIPLAFSQVMVGTIRQPGHPAPPGYEEGQVLSEGLRLRTWTLRGRPDKAAVVVGHGVGDSLESFADLASRIHARGHTVLLLDFRGHGKSEGRHTTLGGREREDLRAAAQALRGRGLAASGLVFMGFSMGAVAALRAAVDQPDVRAVVAEAPYDSYRNTVAHHAWLLYKLPRWTPVIPIAVAIAGWRAGFDPDEVDAVAAARRLRAPLLLIVDGADDRMPEAVVRRILDAHPGPKRLWVAEGAGHVGASLDPAYWPVVLGFLQENGL
jgi:pimeloyl-ACP methyl ester carboxylesterase